MRPPKPAGNHHRRPYQRSGFYAAKQALVRYGELILPGPETPLGRELRDWRLSLIADLGGLGDPTMLRYLRVSAPAQQCAQEQMDAYRRQQAQQIAARAKKVARLAGRRG